MSKNSSPCGPCGTWPSPIDAQLVGQAGTGSAALPREIRVDSDAVYWIEFQPDQDARYAIMRRNPTAEIECLTPAGFSVRSRVHEYGGGAYAVHQKRIFFVNDSDQAIYEQADQGGLVRLFQNEPDHKIRFADLEASPDCSWLVAVRERHLTDSQVVNDLVAISLTGDRKILPLAQGQDFYAAPRFDPSGTRLCWLSWNHPNMPWDATALHTARFEQKGTLEEVQLVAGGMDESIFQPEWSPAGELFFVSDRTGWWNIYRVVDGAIHAVLPMEAEFGRPAWLLGFSSYAFVSDETIAAVYKQDGRPELGLIDIKAGSLQRIETGFTSFELPSIAFAPPDSIWFMAGDPYQAPHPIRVNLAERTVDIGQRSESSHPPEEYLSTPEQIEFPSGAGRRSFAYYYPPCNPDCTPSRNTLPPLIVTAHGGPTSSARPHLDLEVQFWTSRGFAFLDVDYTGSSGYGRTYRRALYGQWGVVDVEDCVWGARFLADQKQVNANQLLIRGRSAGGFVALAALTFFDVFRAGASYFGIGDLLTLAQDTHKFEAHYLDQLVGPLPQAMEVYRQRSPLSHLEMLKSPVILFQGLDDAVVPPELARQISQALEAKHLPYALLEYPGEGHGFKNKETVVSSLEAELEFYQRILGLRKGSATNRITIHNL